MSALFFMAQFQQAALGAGPLTAGLRLLPWGVAVILGARNAAGFPTGWAMPPHHAWPRSRPRASHGSHSSPTPAWLMPQ